jgi:hypothetical protein
MSRYTVVAEGLNAEDRAKHEATYGGFNAAPPGWLEISEAEVATGSHLIRCYMPRHIEYRQITGQTHPDGRPAPVLQVTLYFAHDGTGVAMSFDYHGKRVRWFAFGCEHAWRTVGYDECRTRGIYHAGRCWNVSECTKCGHVNAVDSSDIQPTHTKETTMTTKMTTTILFSSLILSCAANAALLAFASWWLRFSIWTYADLYTVLRVYVLFAGL